jgi:cell division protein FtsA
MPVKIGYPKGFNGLTDIIDNPAYATVLGLILYGGQGMGLVEPYYIHRYGMFGRMADSMKKWFRDFI